MVTSPFKFFSDVYILNLDRRKDRLHQIKKVLGQVFIDSYTRVSAIDHKDGNKGCYLSHLKILDMIASNSTGSALILEDDAEPYDDWNTILPKALKQLPKNWEMLYLGYNIDPHGFKPSGKSPQFISSNLLKLNGCLTTHAYAIRSPVIAARISDSIGTKDVRCLVGKGCKYQSIDVVYSCLVTNKIPTFAIYPMIFKQRSDRSDIINIKVNYPLRANIEAILKKCKEL